MEEKKPEEKELPINFMANEFMDQQLTTLNKQEDKKDATTDDANGNGSTS